MSAIAGMVCPTCEGNGFLHGASKNVIVCEDCEGQGAIEIGVNDNMSQRPTTIIHRDLGLEVDKASVRITRQSTGQVIELSMTEWNWLYQVSVLFDWPMAALVDNAVPGNVG